MMHDAGVAGAGWWVVGSMECRSTSLSATHCCQSASERCVSSWCPSVHRSLPHALFTVIVDTQRVSADMQHSSSVTYFGLQILPYCHCECGDCMGGVRVLAAVLADRAAPPVTATATVRANIADRTFAVLLPLGCGKGCSLLSGFSSCGCRCLPTVTELCNAALSRCCSSRPSLALHSPRSP